MVLAISGPRRVARPTDTRNVGDIERLLSVVGGAGLAAAAIRRRGVGGIALGALAAELIRRGATGRCRLYDRLGVSTWDHTPRARNDLAGAAATVDGRRSVKVEDSITIDAPRVELYDYWREFGNHRHFMSHVESVEPMVNGRTRYTMAMPGGRRVSWESEIVKDYPGELISWKTVGNPDVAHAGSVHFRDTDDGLGTVVTLVMDYEPPGGRAGYALSRLFGVSPEQMIRADLRRVKEIFETR